MADRIARLLVMVSLFLVLTSWGRASPVCRVARITNPHAITATEPGAYKPPPARQYEAARGGARDRPGTEGRRKVPRSKRAEPTDLASLSVQTPLDDPEPTPAMPRPRPRTWAGKMAALSEEDRAAARAKAAEASRRSKARRRAEQGGEGRAERIAARMERVQAERLRLAGLYEELAGQHASALAGAEEVASGGDA